MGRQLVRDSGGLELSAANVQPAGPGCGLCPDAGQTPRGIHNVLSPRNGVLLGRPGLLVSPDPQCP